MISPYKIEWLGETSLDYDCWTGLAFDGDSGDIDTHLGREAIVSEAYNGTLKRAYGYKWNNDFVSTITFMKQDHSNFTTEENRKMLKWLTKSNHASFLNIYKDDSEVVEYAILGNFINVSQYKLGNGRVVGYVCEFESLTPWAFSALYTITKNISGTNNSFTINLNTDDPRSPVYPKVVISNASTEVIIVNAYSASDSVTTKVSNNISGETITLDGANQVVSSSRSSSRIFGNDFNWNWLPLFEGENNITVTGTCTITLQYREPIKCGDY